MFTRYKIHRIPQQNAKSHDPQDLTVKKYEIKDARFIKIVPYPGDVILSIF